MNYSVLIGKSSNKEQVMQTNARINDIVRVIMHADSKASRFTERLAEHLRSADDMSTLHNVWAFTKQHIRYRRDRAGKEVVKSPGRTWEDGYADCKGMSIFIGSILKNLGYKFVYRVARYDSSNPDQGHIYPVVMLDGKEVVVDAVHKSFNREYPYWRKRDYEPAAGAAAVSGPAPKKQSITWAIALLTTFLVLSK